MVQDLLKQDLARRLAAQEAIVQVGQVFSEEEIEQALSVLRGALLFIGKDNCYEQLAYALRELIDNARKANIKRVFFKQEHLNLARPEDYAKGLQTFATRIRDERDFFLGLLAQEPDLKITIRMKVAPPDFVIEVANDCPMLEKERQRVLDKLAKAVVYESMVEVIDEISDESESAGIGIVTVLMLLRKIGIPEDRFTFKSENNSTTFRVAVPLTAITDEETERISEDLIREIETIPQFPDSIIHLSELLRDPSFDFKKVAQLVRRDPALTLEVLRMVNSAYYRRRNRIESVEMAINILGVRGLRGILQSFGARRALEDRYSRELLDKLWEHSNEIAQLVAGLCARLEIPEADAEFAYVGGLLHDMGKIVLQGRHPQTCAALAQICARKNTSAAAVEDLITGVNHALIGAKMAAKWNLPERIVELIKSYRTPLSAPEDIRRPAKVIYLAHVLSFLIKKAEKEYEVGANLLAELDFDIEGGLPQLVEDMARMMHPAEEARHA